ncbi:nucleotide-binding universal stress UspA family protein [Gelidibacter algens]|jgi:nucleotide-binding universal stress UspA family protein|uniref:Nucleotide-binding universal stress UspA family protein n=1 Tax=Gelidibacter algens TaxID=49280 RepID=A0A1A7R6U9_9FLAO|nr:universal stress protein [Gelidibacter algens]OBX27228.1 universal stress protein [Gelidibacter algens]RAJ22089.1 nucleotide-binding universal stress UspA family protein [Gelidibacter algens]
MRNILIPTDFSDNSMNAVKYALELFKYEKCEFYIMHAYEDAIHKETAALTRENLDDVTEMMAAKSAAHLEQILKDIHEISPNPRHTYHSISANNILIDEADSIVNEKNIDLIIMGTRGKSNDKNITFGSQTLQVLKYVQCPVLAIPEKQTYTQPKKILFPTNYLIPFKRRELKLFCDMVAPYRSVIDVVYISKSTKLSIRQEDNQLFIKEALCKNEINFKTLDSKNVVEAIEQYVKDHPIDMLVMVNTRESFLESFLYPSRVDQLSLDLKVPFLAMQNLKRDA